MGQGTTGSLEQQNRGKEKVREERLEPIHPQQLSTLLSSPSLPSPSSSITLSILSAITSYTVIYITLVYILIAIVLCMYGYVCMCCRKIGTHGGLMGVNLGMNKTSTDAEKDYSKGVTTLVHIDLYLRT